MWCPIVISRAKWGIAKSYAFLYKLCISEWPSYAALLHTINIPDTPWCVEWCYLYFDTQSRWILPWADINRNCNIFLLFWALSNKQLLVTSGLTPAFTDFGRLPPAYIVYGFYPYQVLNIIDVSFWYKILSKVSCPLKVVVGGYRRCPDSHDLSECHHLYDLGKHI